MKEFRRGEQVHVRLVFQNVVPITNNFVIFAHEEDQDEQLEQWMWPRDETIPRSLGVPLEFELPIDKETKLGVYALQKVVFETFDGNTLDYRGDIEAKFEVIASDVTPTIQKLCIYTEAEWERLRPSEQE